jgi:hypothetical protein
MEESCSRVIRHRTQQRGFRNKERWRVTRDSVPFSEVASAEETALELTLPDDGIA